MQIKKSPREGQFNAAEEEYQPLDAPEAGLLDRPAADAQPRRREPAAEAPAARPESTIDAHSSFDGRFETDKDLRVEGSVSGEVICRGRLTIEREATARARIQARDAWVKGQVEGDIVCSGKLVLAASAVVNGTIKTAVLVVEEGASIMGTVETIAAGAAERPAPLRASEPRAVSEAISAATEAAATPATQRWNSRSRDLPSFALVASDDRPAADRG
ncbi:MAG: polymer-forming cytoskeletal protein [Chloroflexi bacterium]|nr:polymer-forming cytoskeletal protein [Chloroflexota bacterium]